jgi:hypothetical protein
MASPPAHGPQTNDAAHEAARRRARKRLLLLSVGAAATGAAVLAWRARGAGRGRARADGSDGDGDNGDAARAPLSARRAASAACLTAAGATVARGAWRVGRALCDPGDRSLLLVHDCRPPQSTRDSSSSSAAATPAPFDHRPLVADDTAKLLARCGAAEDLADLAADGTVVAVDCAGYVRRLLREAEEAIADDKRAAGGASAAPWHRGPYLTPPPATVVPGTIVLVGTAHVSAKSVRDAARCVERLCPHVAFVELCSKRARLLRPAARSARAAGIGAGLMPAPLLSRRAGGDEDEEEDAWAAVEEAREEVRRAGLGTGASESSSSGSEDEEEDEEEAAAAAQAPAPTKQAKEAEENDDAGDDDLGPSAGDDQDKRKKRAQAEAPAAAPNGKARTPRSDRRRHHRSPPASAPATTTTPATSMVSTVLAAARDGGGGASSALFGLMSALYARLETQLGVKAGGEFVAARLAAEDLSREGALAALRPDLWERVARGAARRRAAQYAAEGQVQRRADGGSNGDEDKAAAAPRPPPPPPPPPPPTGQPLATRRALLARLALCQPSVALGDRPVGDTLRAMWAALSPSRRLALAGHLFSAACWDAARLDAAAVEALKGDDALAALVSEFGVAFPELLNPLIHDRNYVLASNAWAAGARARAQVAVADAQARHARAWRRDMRRAARRRRDEEAADGAADDGRPYGPMAAWQVAKALSELDGGTRRAGDEESEVEEEEEDSEEEESEEDDEHGALPLPPLPPRPAAGISPPEVVAVVGKSHVAGMVYALRRMCEAFAERVIAQRCALEQVRRAEREAAAAVGDGLVV